MTAADFLELDFIGLKLSDNQCNQMNQKVPMYEFSNGIHDISLLEWSNAMHLTLPLATTDCNFGTLDISKDVVHNPLSPFTLRRIEQLRRTVLDTLIRLNKDFDCQIGVENGKTKGGNG